MTSGSLLGWLLITVHILLVLFGLVRWRRLDAGTRYTWGWALFGLIARLLQDALPNPTDRLVVAHFYLPVSAVLAACALATYQGTRRAADAVRFAGLGYVVAWAIITPLFEQLHEFSRFTAPLRGFLIAVIAGLTMAGNRDRRRWPASEDRGTLIAAGFLVLYLATGVVAPYLATFHPARPVTMATMLIWRDVVVLAGMMPMMWAFMLHDPAPGRRQ
jgi:hypothetical protein